MFGRDAVDEHVCLRGNDGWVDESEKEEAADEGTDGKVCHIWVLSLRSASDAVSHTITLLSFVPI